VTVSDLRHAALNPSAHADTFSRDRLPPPEQWPLFTFTLPGLRYPSRVNCAEELLDGTIARLGGDRPCLYDARGRVWSYARLLDLVNRISWVLTEDLGVIPGNRVMLRGPNTPWLTACWLASLKAGAVVVPTMPMLRQGELRTCAEVAQADFALCDERFVSDLERAGAGSLPIMTYMDDSGSELAWRADRKPARFPAVPTSADDVALIAFTSGTNGKPKATMHFHRDVLAIADTFSQHVIRPRPDDVFGGTPPLAFTFGLGGLAVFPLRAGAAAVLCERLTPEELFASVKRHGTSVLFTAPTAYRAVLGQLADFDLGSLRRCVSAGETLPARTWHAFRDGTGHRIIDAIGSTEMLHAFISATDGDIRPGATGKPVPGYRACVLDDYGDPVGPGVPGRLAVQGPTGCRYLNDERQRQYVQDGWNITGDVYVTDEDGYFWYQARSDDLIVSAGYNIAPPEVEEALAVHPDVAECGVIAAPDAQRGSIVKAYVVLAAGVRGDAGKVSELQDFVKREIAPYKYPREVEFVTALPRTLTGKLRRDQLRSLECRP
jgi:2-aminobenzoate-CoA ligase